MRAEIMDAKFFRGIADLATSWGHLESWLR